MDFLFLFGIPFLVLGMVALVVAGEDFKQKSRGFASMAIGMTFISIFYLNSESFGSFVFSGVSTLYLIFFAIFNYVRFQKPKK